MWPWIIGGAGVALLFWPVLPALGRRLRERRYDKRMRLLSEAMTTGNPADLGGGWRYEPLPASGDDGSPGGLITHPGPWSEHDALRLRWEVQRLAGQADTSDEQPAGDDARGGEAQ